ncbi:molybdenum ABC transporter ATP-binding protein [Rhizobium halophilum]|uniref:molybdenum ABC transporter ATP-binding protein n=1 Tax=Rhizobium halophilum TaxID=2846852 RepID=UPI001EFDAEF7|nr:molybdenum ABC transporter ATP-binding protein [Rhizobium halophilum]MCF6368002.1 molybdenum ABC transporter ATP-binding protein [Rhizobium halophilum]
MTLIVEARHRFGSFRLSAAFSAEGGVTALFGRSGSGKTSLLRIIAGLARPDEGEVLFNDQVLLDTSAAIFVKPHRRRFGYVFQEARLFPHLSVRSNLLYGRRFAGNTLTGANFARVVEMLGISQLLGRAPGALSGGEQQRVAIGRALLSGPRLLLMDEPLAALDEERKAEILPYLERLRDEAGVPIIYVSHSVTEVARLADQVVLLEAGKVVATGDPSHILSGRVASALDRKEAGSVLSGVVEGLDPDSGLARVKIKQRSLLVPSHGLSAGKAVRVHVPERDVIIAVSEPQGLSALNILPGRITTLKRDDDTVVITANCGGDEIFARVTSFSSERLGLSLGQEVYAVIKSVALER